MAKFGRKGPLADAVRAKTLALGQPVASVSSLSGSGVAPDNAQYLTLAVHADLSAERVFTVGDGLDETDAGAGGTYTVGVDVTDFVDTSYGLTESSNNIRVNLQASGGLDFYTGAIGVDVSDFAGTGLEDDGAENLRIAASAAGSGLTGGGGSALALNWGTPTIGTIEPDDAAAAGTSTNPARSDHQHAIVCAAAGTISPDDSAAEGSASSFARSDHTHEITCDVAGTISPDDSAEEGTAYYFARSDHQHEITCAAATTLSVSTTNAEGSASSFARSDHLHTITSSSNPGAAASLLASDASGYLQLVGLGIGTAATAQEARIDGDLVFVGAQSISTTAGNLTLAPAGDLILNPTGNDVLPTTNYDINLGSISKKYLTLHAAELWVQTLVAADVMATIGGRIIIAPTTYLTSDLGDGAGDTTITVEHNNLADGDLIVMESNGKLEWMEVDSAAGGAGPYTYTVVRDKDGTGRNAWYAGDGIVNTGAAGDGFIDLYSDSGIVAGSTAGPTIVGNVRDSATYNDYTECWAIGNLNGLYGYSSDTYGLGLGKYGTSHVTIDATDGIKFYAGADVVGEWQPGGDVIFGKVATDKANLFWDQSGGKLNFRGGTNGTVVEAYIDTDGTITAGGGEVKLNSDGLLINFGVGNVNKLRWYNTTDTADSVQVYAFSGVTYETLEIEKLNADAAKRDAIIISVEGDSAAETPDIMLYSNVAGTGYAGIELDAGGGATVFVGETITLSGNTSVPTGKDLAIYDGKIMQGSFLDDTYIDFGTLDQLSFYCGNVEILRLVEDATDYIAVRNRIVDIADTNTYIDFGSAADQMSFYAGGVQILKLVEDTTDYAVIDGHLGVGDSAPSPGAATLYVDAIGNANSWAMVFYGDTTTSQSYGAVFVAGTNSTDTILDLRNTSNVNQFKVRGDGAIFMLPVYSDAVGGTNRDLYIDNTGQIGYVSSSIRHKKNISNISTVDWLYELRPVEFDYRVDDVHAWGLIAEEVAEIQKMLVSYDDDTNQPETVEYSRLIVPLLKAVQDLKARIDTLA